MLLALLAEKVVATFHLHYLGHGIKYGNLEAGNTTEQLFSATWPCCSSEFIQSLLLVILVIYNIYIYIYIYIGIYIYKVSYIHSFLLFSTVMFFLRCMLNIIRYEQKFVKLMSQLLHSTIHQVVWYFWVFIVNPFYLL